ARPGSRRAGAPPDHPQPAAARLPRRARARRIAGRRHPPRAALPAPRPPRLRRGRRDVRRPAPGLRRARLMRPELIGWASSLILLVTLLKQVWKQYRARTVEGVSKWLYWGQTAASGGFVAYSALLPNRVFLVPNA